MKFFRDAGDFLCLGLAGLVLLFTPPARAQDRQVLLGHVPKAITGLDLQPVGRLPSETRLHLAIGLPLRNQEALTSLLHQIYDPTSPQYHHYLKPEEFTEKFGPTEQDYQAVIGFAKSNGLTVAGTHPNRVLLDVNGSVAKIEKVFHVEMRVYRHPTEARTFYAPDTDPSIDLAVPVSGASGLDNYMTPHPMIQRTPLNLVGNVTTNTGSGPNGTYLGYDFRAAYVPGVALNGSGEAVGLLEMDGYYTNDITAYESQAGLPNVTLTNVLVDGFSGSPGDDNDEVALDIDMAICMAPGLSEVIVYESPQNYSEYMDMLNRMATDDLAMQLSSSWAWTGVTKSLLDATFQEFAAQGQSFFNASGDLGAYVGTIWTPADDPYITVVGGTTLATSGPTNNWVSETTWNSYSQGSVGASGGGISTTYAIPWWQTNVSMSANQGSTAMRNLPDVALTANNVFLIADNGNSYVHGITGTSCASPLWAGFTALVNQQAVSNGDSAVGFLNPALYAIGTGITYTDCFHDITTGNNTNRYTNTEFFAASGYDLCTGWGTPNGSNLINALAPIGYTYTTNSGNTITITGYAGSGGAVTVPSTINGLTVTGIGADAFTDNISLTSIIIPASVTNIGNQAFSSCAGLTVITVDTNNPAYSSVAGVLFDKGQTTLLQCPGGIAGSYTVPNSVTSIGDNAFEDCTSLTSIIIPNSVTSIGNQVFLGCTSLTAITVDTNNPAYSSVAGVLFDKSQATLLQCPGGIGGGYTIPSSVTSIGDNAFEGCSGLTSVTIPNSITSIGDFAFSYCSSLTGIYFLGNAPSLGGGNVFALDNNATVYFLAGTTGWSTPFGGLPAVLLPFTYTTANGAIAITGYTGSGGAVTVPSTINGRTVTSIGDDAFTNDIDVTSVILPNGVTSIGLGAFSNCTSLA
ncbi:MAG: leucine-rich repeat protein [Verrucomicrobiia bacterium]